MSHIKRATSTLTSRLYSNLKYSLAATMYARMGQEIVSDEQCSERKTDIVAE